jgi:hypothetical protein
MKKVKKLKPQEEWKTVKNANVRQVWQCANSDCEEKIDGVEEYFSPSPTVQDGPGNDTPYCPGCNGAMRYLRTEVLA